MGRRAIPGAGLYGLSETTRIAAVPRNTRSTALSPNAAQGALIGSLPLVSILAMIWLWTDAADAGGVARLSAATFWLVLPTLPMFLVLPGILGRGRGFYPALLTSARVMLLSYLIAVPVFDRFGMSI